MITNCFITFIFNYDLLVFQIYIILFKQYKLFKQNDNH